MSEVLPTLPQLAAYLVKNQWAEKQGRKRLSFTTGTQFLSDHEVSYRIFERAHEPGEEPTRVVLPVNPNGTTPDRYIESALSVLAGFYQRSASQLAVAIRAFNVDILFGIHPRNTVSLARAHEILTNLKNVVVQAANAELDPKPHSPDARGNRIVDSVNFGHTFVGSFGFQVECPLSTADRQMEIGETPRPLERRLLERLALGFLTVEQAAAIHDISPVCENYRVGLTANICDALTELCEPSDTEPFTFRFEWSTLFPVVRELREQEVVFKVNARRYALLQEASEALKRMVVEQPAELVGTVVALSSDVPPLQRGLIAHRKVTLQIVGGDHDKHKMQLEVSDDDYRLALAAHERGRFVKVAGTPVQRGTHWRIDDHSGLRPVE